MESRFQSMLFDPARESASHRGAAFIIETLLLLVFVTASVAVVVQLLGVGYEQGVKAERLSCAVLVASNEAERFTADPTQKSSETVYLNTAAGIEKVAAGKKVSSKELEFDGESLSVDDADVLVMKRKVTSKELDSGTMYNASISVECQGEEIYSIDTCKYVSENVTNADDSGDDASGDDWTGAI